MARINRNKLSHGTKLIPDHLNTSLGSATTAQKGNLVANQIEPNRNNFYVSWNIPVINSTWGETQYAEFLETPFYFILPPTQDKFSDDYHTREQTILLEEIMFSWDQNANPLAYTDTFDADEKPSLRFDGIADAYKVRIRIYEKTPEIVAGVVPVSPTPENLIYQLDIESSSFLSVKYRNNPLVQGSLNIPINPYKSYILTISFPDGLNHEYTAVEETQTRSVMLPSTNIRAKFSNVLLPPDIGGGRIGEIQNVPLVHSGQNQFPPTTTVPSWNPEDYILATDQGGQYGIQTAIDNIDVYANQGYKGGLTKTSDNVENSAIKDFYGYDVICVPMFQTLDQIRRATFEFGENKDVLPYIIPDAGTILGTEPSYSMDRRRIHISHPFIIHHIFCSVSFFANKTDLIKVGNPAASHGFNTDVGVYRPDSSISREVGVFIANGIRSDHYDWQQVAYLPMNQAYLSYRVDRAQIVDKNGNPNGWGSVDASGLRFDAYDAELWQVPINYGSSRTGFGFTENGTPFFTGQSTLRTNDRQQCYSQPFLVGVNTALQPKTKGMEQWIEVRGKISSATPFGTIPEGGDRHETILGRGGWYVYLIGKRALTY